MNASREIVVVGGGVVGAALTYYLAKSGARVTLIERDSPGVGVSGASFGYINAAQKRPEHYHRLSRLGVEAYDALEEELGLDSGLGPRGGLLWPEPGSLGGKEMEALVEELRHWQYPFELLTSEEAAQVEPGIRVARVENSILYLPYERWVEGNLLAAALVSRAGDYGAKVMVQCSALKILHHRGAVDGVSMSEGSLRADTVIVAAGTGSVGLLASLGYHLPLDRVVGVLGITSPRPGLLRGAAYPGAYHVRPTPEGRIVIGAQEVDRLADERTDVSTPPPWADRLLQMAQRDMPGLQGLRLEEVWLGVRPMPADRLPIIGRVPGIEGVYVAVMHSGITLASIVGQALSTEVVTGERAAFLEPYRPDRAFPAKTKT